MTTLSVVIPAYNEENGISQIIERTLSVRPHLAEAGVEGLELIVVDDGSHDDTAAITSRYADVHLVRHRANQGYGAALKTGFSRAQGELLGFLDADGTYPPEHFPHLCLPVVEEAADLVIGSRMAGADSQMPLVRRAGNLFFASLINLLSHTRISDSSSGMRVLRREVLAQLYPLPDGLNFTPVMSTRAIHEKVSMAEVPIPYEERVGRSKLSVVGDGMRFLSTIVWTALSYNPVRILGGMGLGLGVVAALVLAIVTGIRIAGITELGPWGVAGLIVAGLCAVAGITLFSLGAVFNYLVSLFYRRPIRQGLFGRPLLKRPLERQFGWMGGLAVVLGLAVGGVSLVLSLGGWPIERLWLYLLGATTLVIVGLQLGVFWVIIRVLDELSQRETRVAQDLEGKPCDP